MSSKFLSLIFFTAIFAVVPFISHAGTGLSIQPIKISETLTKGASVSGKILLTNASEEDVKVEMKTEDFVPSAGAEGIQFVGRAPGITTVRDWIQVDRGTTSFTFRKGEAREIPYTITAPKDAEPGSHFGVIFFKAIKLSDEFAQIKVGTQVGVLVLITVPGNYKQTGKILNFKAPLFTTHVTDIPFIMSFENTGTVHFEPKGTIEISNMFGSKVALVPIGGQVVLPTGIKELLFTWHSTGLLFGRYSASASVYDGAHNLITSDKVAFYAFPLWYILGFLLAIVMLYLIIKFLKSKIKISVNLK